MRAIATPCAHQPCRRTTTNDSGLCHDHQRPIPGMGRFEGPRVSSYPAPSFTPAADADEDEWVSDGGVRHPTGGYDRVWESGDSISYFQNGPVRHREDGPALIRHAPSGYLSSNTYFLDDRLHRTEGPAIIEFNKSGKPKSEEYFVRGERHRTDGPALVHYSPNGKVRSEQWFIGGEPFEGEKLDRLREALDSGAPIEWAIAYAEGGSS